MKNKVNNSRVDYIAIALLFIVAIFFTGCKKEATPGPNEVFMQNTAFNPSSITIPVNSSVTWTNKDGMAHNVTSNTGVFASGDIANGGTYSYTFKTAGTFSYRCTIHSGMNGTVVVQ